MDRHCRLVYGWVTVARGFLSGLLLRWRDSVVGGLRSLVTLGTTALFIILWSCFLCSTPGTSLVYVLLSLVLLNIHINVFYQGAAAAAIHYLGFTPGLLIVGFYGILIMWMYGYVWITTMLLIVGGYMFSLNHARFLILMATAYAVYCVNAHVGLHGVLLSLNISFISNDILNNFLQGFDGNGKGIHVKEQKEPEQVIEDFPFDSENSPLTKETEDMTYSKSSCTTPKASKLSNTQKDASSSKVNIVDLTSLVEIERIMNSSNHYEVLGFLRNKNVDPNILKKEYHKKVLLVHPDKNMGNSVACESFKKLQCAYEVLSDFTKKKNYDEQLRKEESGRVCHRSSVMSQQLLSDRIILQGGVEYRSEESRCIECTKCGNSHIWICTNRSKAKARWCQDCSQYHQAKDGDGWVESGCSPVVMPPRKVEIPRAFVCAESKIFDVSEWAICQGMACRPDTHGPTFHVNMVGLDTTGLRSNSSRYPWGLDAEMIDEDELWLQQPLASGIFSETQKRRKGWPFKINQKSMRPWRKLP
ncbi:heat shock protein DnaJ [Musa troglodytarum]|uniref:Heat shock protein DnaJ n=1 Tax=Musa troglodytarum TaxID=320322 RepID=A0A9E7I2Q5_9LILI|nr:heat shock protein DnaJ [Musa troglodytarum]